MKVQSTGLGKTVMLAHFQDLFKTSFDDEQVLQMNMESTEPLHWTIRVYMDPKDIRRAVWMGLKPSILWKAFLALVFGRFSLFGKMVDNSGKSESKEMVPSVEPLDRPGPSGSNAISPLASLKSGSDDERKPNPLASLKG